MRERLIRALLRLYECAVKLGLLDRPLGAARVRVRLPRLQAPARSRADLAASRPGRGRGRRSIDVGANIGFFALRFGRWVGPEGRVIAIEPEARNVESLRRRVSRAASGGRRRVRAGRRRRRAGELRLGRQPDHPGDHQIADQAAGPRRDARRADRRRRRASVSLVKIDVQGAEFDRPRGRRRASIRATAGALRRGRRRALRGFGSSAAELFASIVGARLQCRTR